MDRETQADETGRWFRREDDPDLTENISPTVEKLFRQIMPNFHDKSVTALAPLTPDIAGAHCRDFEDARMDAPVSGTLLTILPATLQRAAAGAAHRHARDLEIVINATRIAGIASRNQDAQPAARLLTAMADAVLHA